MSDERRDGGGGTPRAPPLRVVSAADERRVDATGGQPARDLDHVAARTPDLLGHRRDVQRDPHSTPPGGPGALSPRQVRDRRAARRRALVVSSLLEGVREALGLLL